MGYKFIREPYIIFKKGMDDGYSDGVTVTMELPQDIAIPELLLNFEQLMRASGYVFDGNLEIVAENEELSNGIE